MKKTIILVMALLCLNFWANAQAVDVTTKGIQIGQQVPSITLTNLHNYKDASGKSATTAKLTDFKGKLLILDFWATWCVPCVTVIPKLEKLQKQFEGKIQILPVAYQKEKDILPILTDLKKDGRIIGSLPNVVADIDLNKLFPHIYLPHYVWIDESGMVRAITDSKSINEIEISKVMSQNYEGIGKKKDFKLAFDDKQPLFVNGNGGDGSTVTYHSMLSTYIQGIGPGFTIAPPSKGTVGFTKMLARNLGIMHLFNVALGGGKKQYRLSRTIFETKDSLLLNPLKMGDNWRNLAWTYELSLQEQLQSQGYQIMHTDLIKLFPQYSIKLEKRKMLCYALRKLPGKNVTTSVGGDEIINQSLKGLRMRNGSLNLFINTLDAFYFSNSKIPVVNLVEDKTLTDLIIDAPLTDVYAINLELTKYGLELIKGEFEIDMVVYRDSVKQFN